MARYESSASDFKGNWTPLETFCQEGPGVEGEGEITEMRFHTVTATDRVERYIALVLDISIAFTIAKDKYGVEVSLDPKEYKTSDRVLSHDQLAERTTPRDGQASKSSLAKLHPTVSGKFEFWAPAGSDARKFDVGDAIHFKTFADSWFLNTFHPTSVGKFSHMTGGEVMNQASKIADTLNKDEPLYQDLQEGCDSDEWSD